MNRQENPYSTILSSKFCRVKKYLTVTNHIHSPWIVLVNKKWWKTRNKAFKAIAELKAKSMLVNELSLAWSERIRSQLTAVCIDSCKEVGMDLWNDIQKELARVNTTK